MKKFLFKIISTALAVIMMISVAGVAFAADGDENSVTLTVASVNAAGLPIPSAFSDDKRVVPTATKEYGQVLNNSGVDIICVQEDFQYHPILAKQMTNYPYQTYTSGGIPVGDGLNVFSKYPIYNIERVEWEVSNGILDAGNDALTPKGFVKFTIDVCGALVDVYNVHVDAYGSDADNIVKCAQFKQLKAYIEENSAERAVMITGDYNTTLHSDYLSQYYEVLIEDAGFTDVWVETENGGNYFRGDDALVLINNWFRDNNGLYWGIWDSVERLLCKDYAGITITPINYEYVNYNPAGTQYYSDHNVGVGTVKITVGDDYVRPDVDLKKPSRAPIFKSFFHGVWMVVRCIYRILSEAIPKLFAGELF